MQPVSRLPGAGRAGGAGGAGGAGQQSNRATLAGYLAIIFGRLSGHSVIETAGQTRIYVT